jgi:hypothetical protein
MMEIASERIALAELADQIAARVGCDGLGAWLYRLAFTMHLPPQQLLPEPAVTLHQVQVPHAGIRLELWHPHAAAKTAGDPERWVITRVVFEAPSWRLPWPFGLDAELARYRNVMQRLPGRSVGLTPRDIAAGDLRQSIFMDDGLVVGLEWRPEGLGFERMELVRIGAPISEPVAPCA